MVILESMSKKSVPIPRPSSDGSFELVVAVNVIVLRVVILVPEFVVVVQKPKALCAGTISEPVHLIQSPAIAQVLVGC